MPKCAPILANAKRNTRRANKLVAEQNAIATRQNAKANECNNKLAAVDQMDKTLEMWKRKSVAEKSTLLNTQKLARAELRNKHMAQYAAWKKQRAAMVKDQKACAKDYAKLTKQWLKKKSQVEAAEGRESKYVNSHQECKSLPRKKRAKKSPASVKAGPKAAPKVPKAILQ